jgi:nucleotide-binding universal stress UspA family protein
MESPANAAQADGMSIVLCGVDDTEAGTTVMTAAKAAARRAGAPLLLTHVATSHWGANVPAFHADADATTRVVEHGPPARRILAVADGHDAALIVLGTRALRWRASVARHVSRRAGCPVLIVGPRADPEAEPVTRPGFDRGYLQSATTPVLVVPSP